MWAFAGRTRTGHSKVRTAPSYVRLSVFSRLRPLGRAPARGALCPGPVREHSLCHRTMQTVGRGWARQGRTDVGHGGAALGPGEQV